MKFNFAHFPVGTQVRGHIGPISSNQAFEGVVKYLVKNGANSYCIRLEESNGNKPFINICYVTEIMKRGSGELRFIEQSFPRVVSEYQKHHSQYAVRSFHIMVFEFIEKIATIDQVYDIDAITQCLQQQTFVKRVHLHDWDIFLVAPKKKVNQFLKKIANKHLVSLKEQIKFEEELYADCGISEDDLYDDFF